MTETHVSPSLTSPRRSLAEYAEELRAERDKARTQLLTLRMGDVGWTDATFRFLHYERQLLAVEHELATAKIISRTQK